MSLNPAIAAKIAGARTTGGGNYIKDGRYTFIVEKVICEKKFAGNFFIVEFFVKDAAAVSGEQPNPQGTSCTMALRPEARSR